MIVKVNEINNFACSPMLGYVILYETRVLKDNMLLRDKNLTEEVIKE